MALTSFRTVEPLYIIIIRNIENPEQQFKKWIQQNQIEHAFVAGNRMMLHDQRAFDRLLITWAGNWDSMTIWDAWNKRHIYI